MSSAARTRSRLTRPQRRQALQWLFELDANDGGSPDTFRQRFAGEDRAELAQALATNDPAQLKRILTDTQAKAARRAIAPTWQVELEADYSPADVWRYVLDALQGVPAKSRDAATDRAAVAISERRAADREAALHAAHEAWTHRREADRDVVALAPGWPAHRQPGTDRAILRLAHYEMNHTDAPPKEVVDHAVGLAKEFGTERSGAFVNGVLDKVLKRVLAERAAPQDTEPAP